ncbi:ABC transporter permease [Hoyosella altamirensis]|uniref:ABC-2 type transport system permease protein n=1 Tax=Hoyosella altamirensis TaxID=616997 RepID=A0A839RNC0_9ACTN|nr:ABC transporter permease [Hoyosella altamirensis]MBB3037644.1 ABC-2 type transport system permease protein [Hoyosella altamirensis]
MTSGVISLSLTANETLSSRSTALRQWAALSTRSLREMARNGDFIIALITPAIFTLAYYVPLRTMLELPTYMGGGGVRNYGQFVVPLIAFGAVALTMQQAALKAARDAQQGMTARLYTMPIPRAVPLFSRMTGNFARAIVALAAAIAYGHIINFRFEGGALQAAFFVAFVLFVGFSLILGADALGTITANPRAVTQALTLPILIFGMMSTGLIPETGFPEFAQPFVRNQPVSQFAETMRAFAGGTATWETVGPGLVWSAALFVALGGLAVWAAARRR